MNDDELIACGKAAAQVGTTDAMSPTEKADALESAMVRALDLQIMKPWACDVTKPVDRSRYGQGRFLMGDDPRLPRMPKAPTLVDYFEYRIMLDAVGGNHLLQSAKLAQKRGAPEKLVLACLLHDISLLCLMRTDHGYWAAQLVAPYVDEEVAWAIRYHQALRYVPAPEYDYAYPEFYHRVLGEDYRPEPYIIRDAQKARAHRWYGSAMQIVVNDFYAFDPGVRVELGDFVDIIGRHFAQPSAGLGFDDSPSAHMWRTILWPNNFF